MKELSIEEKAKAYDEAKERMKDFLKEWEDCGAVGEAMEKARNVFPELKESEDEKIIKSLIGHLKECRNNTRSEVMIGEYAKWIDWLEKRGKTFTKKDIDDAYLKGLSDAKQEFEKQGEQKPTDKVEPKFCEGEWLCENEPNNYARFIQILEIVNVQGKDRYRISRDIHNDEDIVKFDFVEKYYHKFDIKDAKDGDVLFYRGNVKYSDGIKFDRILLFENLDKSFFVLTKYSNGSENYGIDVNIDYPDNTVPATKEQKEILFMVMKEAGYEWNTDKKELKKIEPTLDWSEEDEGFYIEAVKLLTNQSLYETCVNLRNEVVNWLKSLKDRIQPQPQNRWKPTKEQLEALEHSLGDYNITVFEERHKILTSLYNELKKLKG